MSIGRHTSLVAFAALVLGCGSSVTVGGPAPDAGATPADLGLVVDAGSPVDVPADVRTSCRLPGGGVCLVGQSCRHPDGCNTCSCYGGGEFATCTTIGCVVPDASVREDVVTTVDAGPGGCRSSSDCGSGRECRVAEAGCGMVGVCGFLSDCAAVQPYCDCRGQTFMACPSSPDRPWVSRGACAVDGGVPVDASPSPDAAVCAGASLGRGGGYCAGPADGPLPITCCTDWNCDQRLVACNGIPPTCAAGEVPSVTFSCYGPCVPATHCAPISCGSGCPRGWTCDPSATRCRYAG